MPPPRRPDPEPLRTDDLRVVVVGTGAWLVLLISCLVFHDRLDDHGNGDWVWIALAGFGLGLIGIPWVRRLRRD